MFLHQVVFDSLNIILVLQYVLPQDVQFSLADIWEMLTYAGMMSGLKGVKFGILQVLLKIQIWKVKDHYRIVLQRLVNCFNRAVIKPAWWVNGVWVVHSQMVFLIIAGLTFSTVTIVSVKLIPITLCIYGKMKKRFCSEINLLFREQNFMKELILVMMIAMPIII